MRTELLYLWRVPDERKPGRTHVTRFRMSEADALASWPTAERIDSSVEQRLIYETLDERMGITGTGASATQRG